jgi:hypothetical protein
MLTEIVSYCDMLIRYWLSAHFKLDLIQRLAVGIDQAELVLAACQRPGVGFLAGLIDCQTAPVGALRARKCSC